MKATLRWIQEFVPDLKASAEEVGKRLTAAGLEVEAITDLAKAYDKVVVGKLLEVNRHPTKETITVCRVSIGAEERRIVCGAQNHKVGDKVAAALHGAVLPGNFKIEKKKVYGEVSEGMLCSEKELGLSNESQGIWILPASAVEGTPLAQAMNLGDAIFEIGITPNRGDCLSIAGLAREVAAAFGLPLKQTVAEVPHGNDAAARVKVVVDDVSGCPRYIARVIDGVTIGQSPAWMRQRLEQCGIRPINNVVDVTNYVMLEMGQPLHAFDARLLDGNSIVVRRAKPGETMKTLDGVERKLLAGGIRPVEPDAAIGAARTLSSTVTPDADDYDLVIADAKKPVAIAGVMGGEHSGVQNDTKTIVLESAWFDPARVRRTARRHGLHTESSHRFERAVDAAGVDRASARAASLIAELGTGKIVPGKVESSVPGLGEPRVIRLSVARARSLLGMDVGAARIAELLSPLAIGVEGGGDTLTCTAPPFRDDLREEVDLVEEIARRIGYDQIPASRPTSYLTAENVSIDLEKARRAREILVGFGFAETVHLPFGARDEAAKLKLAPDDPRARVVFLANPLADDQAVLRGSLLPPLLMNVARQRAHRHEDVRIFELRSTFRRRDEGKLPDESRRLTGVLSGRRAAAHWSEGAPSLDFFDAKGVVEAFVGAFCAKTPTFSASTEPFLVTGAQAKVEAAGRVLGVLGELHPDVLRAFDVSARAFAFDLDYEALAALAGATPHFAELARFPAIARDVALVVDEQTEVGAMLSFARNSAKKNLESVDVFDLYRGEKLGAGKKSVALGMTWRAADKTLTDDEANSLQEKLVSALVDRFHATVRA
ncbi:MAG TPA: phenylalanine--tRNA ligase subunit beta [bacterium]|nr:phenylalanine--tRNA ligase subunit beta [bacterium]